MTQRAGKSDARRSVGCEVLFPGWQSYNNRVNRGADCEVSTGLNRNCGWLRVLFHQREVDSNYGLRAFSHPLILDNHVCFLTSIANTLFYEKQNARNDQQHDEAGCKDHEEENPIYWRRLSKRNLDFDRRLEVGDFHVKGCI